MEPQFEVLSMFPVPLYVGKLEGAGDVELRFMLEVEYEPETHDGNRVSKDRRILHHPRLTRLRRVVESHLNTYRKAVMCTDNELYITQSWTNRNARSSQHASHYHANSVLSGTLYLSVDEQVPPIVFKSDRKTAIQVSYKEQNIYTADTFSFWPRTSVIVLFPSTIEHFVPVNQSDTTRLSLAFNTFVRGHLGRESALTELSLD